MVYGLIQNPHLVSTCCDSAGQWFQCPLFLAVPVAGAETPPRGGSADDCLLGDAAGEPLLRPFIARSTGLVGSVLPRSEVLVLSDFARLLGVVVDKHLGAATDIRRKGSEMRRKIPILVWAIERNQWELAALCLLLGLAETISKLPPDTVVGLFDALNGGGDERTK